MYLFDYGLYFSFIDIDATQNLTYEIHTSYLIANVCKNGVGWGSW